MAKEWAKKFYHSRKWLKVRLLCLIRDHYICQECGEAAYIVHHIIELSPQNINDPSISLNLSNLESVCHDCHNHIHDMCESKSLTEGLGFTDDGDIIEVRKPDKLRDY